MSGSQAAVTLLLLLGGVAVARGATQAEKHSIAAAQPAAAKLAAVERLTQSLLEDGAEIHVAVREAGPGAGLGLFAARDIRAGDTLLSLPTDRGFRAVTANGVMDLLLEFVLDMHDPDSPRSLMWATTPQPQDVRHLLNFPAEYLPLLQHKGLEEWMGTGLHADLRRFQQLHADVLAAAGITYDHIVSAMGLIGTRTFARPAPEEGRLQLVYALPLLDMANHDNGCPNFNEFGPCAFDGARECVFFTAGADVSAGQEVCFWYGHLLPDRAFLEYGFLPQAPPTAVSKQAARRSRAVAAAAAATGPNATATADSGAAPAATKRKRPVRKAAAAAEAQAPALPLFSIDRHDFDLASPLPKMLAEPQPFTGNSSSLQARVQGLQQLLDQLRAGDGLAAQVAAGGAAASDPDGRFLQQLLAWRQQRQAAVAGEIARLQRLQNSLSIKQALASRRR